MVAGALALLACWGQAQELVRLPDAKAATQKVAQPFAFASDGPIGPGWTRPDQIARVYAEENLPALFRRSVRLDGDVPRQARLSWIFTGPHAGVTVELTGSTVRVFERYYDSTGLRDPSGSVEKIVRDEERPYSGRPRVLTVIVDAHLSVQVLLNGTVMLTEPLIFDLTRHQLMFSGPRNQHLTLTGGLLEESAEQATITVAPEKQHQTMLGFGGSPSVPAYARMSAEGKRQYWELLKRYNLLVDREYPMGTELKPDLSNVEELRDATPHYYGDNFPNGEVSDFDYSRRTRELGGIVLYEMWALPRWAVEAYTPAGKPILDAWGKAVRTAAKPEVYARIVVEFCRRAKQRSGAAPEIVGIQNEVEQAPEIYAAMTVAVRKALDAAGFGATKIQMADAPYLWMGTGRAEDAKRFPEEWRAIDYTAAHEYDFQEFLPNPDLYDERLQKMRAASGDKPFLATEICLNDGKYQEASYRLALQVGQLYQKNLTELDAEMLLYCWLLLDVEQPNFGASRSLLVPDRSRGEVPVASSFELRVLGAFSRHVLKGMRRVETKATNADLLTAAFTDGTRDSVIVLNRSSSAQRVQMDWVGGALDARGADEFLCRERGGGGGGRDRGGAGRDRNAGEFCGRGRRDGCTLKLRWVSEVVVLSVFVAACGAQTPVSHATDAGVMPKAEFIYEPGSTSFPECHASTIVALKNGELLAAWFGGTHERAPDVAIWTARYAGGRWSAPVEVAREKNIPTWNPVLFHTKDGRLWLYYKAGESPAAWSGARMWSGDEGRTWSKFERLPAGLLGPIRAKPLVMADGTIVSGSSVEAYKTWAAWIERSSDGGETWSKIGPITVTEAQDRAETPAAEPPFDSPELRGKDKEPRTFEGIIQPSVVSLGGRHLRLYARSRTLAAKIVVADSTDGGVTWSGTHFLDLPNNNSGLDAVALKDGRVVMIFNDTPRGRSPLNLAVSTDGEHFRVFATLEQGAGEYSYPAIIQAPGGDLEMTYTWHRTTIKHVHLALAQVPKR